MKILISRILVLSLIAVNLPAKTYAEEFELGQNLLKVNTPDGPKNVMVIEGVDPETNRPLVSWDRDGHSVRGVLIDSGQAISLDIESEKPSNTRAPKNIITDVKMPNNKVLNVELAPTPTEPNRVIGFYESGEPFEAILSKDKKSARLIARPVPKTPVTASKNSNPRSSRLKMPSFVERTWNSGPVQPVRNISRMGTSFYLSMGIMAGLAATLDHQDNPMSLSDFKNSWDNPVLYLVLAGYGFVAGFGSYIYKERLSQGGFGALVPTAGILFAATVAADVSRVMFSEESMKQCYGLFSAKKIVTLNWERDASKCDEAWYTFRNNWMNGQYLNDLVPSITNMMLSTGVYFGLSYAVRQWVSPFLFNKLSNTFLANLKLKPNAFLKSPTVRAMGRFGYGMIFLVGSYVVFQTVNKVTNLLPLQKWFTERFATTWSLAFSKDPLGSTLQQNFSNVQDYYRAARDHQFHGFESYKLALLIERMQQRTYAWRNLQLGGSTAAIQQWAAKIARFQTAYDQSYALYQQIVKKIADEREAKSNSQSLSPSELFNWDNTITTIRAESNSFSKPYEAPNSWELVKPTTLGEYLIVSAACGPNPDQVNEGIQNQNLIRDHRYSEIEFLPPSLVQHDGQQTICDYQLNNKALHKAFEIFDVTGAFHDGSGFHYGNLVDYIKANIRPDIISQSNHDFFEQWWHQNVYLAQVVPAYKIFEAEYKHLVEQNLKPALYNEEFRCFQNPSPSNGGTKFENNFTHKGNCSSQDFSLGYGAIQSVYQENNFYFDLLNDAETFVEKLSPPDQKDNRIAVWESHMVKLSATYEKVFKMLGSAKVRPDYVKPQEIRDLNSEISDNQKAFQAFLTNQLQAGQTPEKVDALKATVENLKMRINADTGGGLFKPYKTDRNQDTSENALYREIDRFAPIVQGLHADGQVFADGKARANLMYLEDDLIKDAYQYVLFSTVIRNSYQNLAELMNYRIRINMLDPRNFDRRNHNFDEDPDLQEFDDSSPSTQVSNIETEVTAPEEDQQTVDNKSCLEKSAREITRSSHDNGVRFHFLNDSSGRISKMTVASRSIDRVYRIDFDKDQNAQIRMAKSVFKGPSTFEKVFGWFVTPKEDNTPVWLSFDDYNRWARNQQFQVGDPAILIQTIVDSKKDIENKCSLARSARAN